MAAHLTSCHSRLGELTESIYEYNHNINNTFYQMNCILTVHPLILNEFAKSWKTKIYKPHLNSQ